MLQMKRRLSRHEAPGYGADPVEAARSRSAALAQHALVDVFISVGEGGLTS
jgi:hypothetical protein